MNWYTCIALPLQPGSHECWFSGAFFIVEASSPDHADRLFRQNAGYGPEVRTMILLGTVM